jgi:hypothetical protein
MVQWQIFVKTLMNFLLYAFQANVSEGDEDLGSDGLLFNKNMELAPSRSVYVY